MMKEINVEWDGWYLRPVAIKNVYWARVFSWDGIYHAQINTIPVDDNADAIYIEKDFKTPEDAMAAIEKKLDISTCLTPK